jgi:hypothetical protein
MDRNCVIHGHVAKEFCGAAIGTVAGEIVSWRILGARRNHCGSDRMVRCCANRCWILILARIRKDTIPPTSPLRRSEPLMT